MLTSSKCSKNQFGGRAVTVDLEDRRQPSKPPAYEPRETADCAEVNNHRMKQEYATIHPPILCPVEEDRRVLAWTRGLKPPFGARRRQAPGNSGPPDTPPWLTIRDII